MRATAVALAQRRREFLARKFPKKVKHVNGAITMRAGAGLGDAIYLQSVARYFVEKGSSVEVCTYFPDVFLPLHGRIRVSKFRREGIKKVAHYTGRKGVAGTDQFQDCCIAAGINEPVEFRLDWAPRNTVLVEKVRGLANGRPIVFVQLPRNPMGRTDKYGDEILPDCSVIQRVIDALSGRAFLMQVGHGAPRHAFRGLDLNLANRTTVSDALDVGSIAHAFLGYCSFIIPLAESQRKPALLVWSRRGLNSVHEFVKRITPTKILHRPQSSKVIMDDCSPDEILGAANNLFDQIASSRPV